ncbi:MATE family efflux transporter [Mycoplasmopsis columbinasalis]|uniref:MATE efflux family protein n=1 Tax=Mycoplasmopsis columbinasalis TaxID=114880 RepID=A0A449BAV0_9BACT|nr:MATE family efflux transporter [Mycoplasmopsis columbinasalis]VEU78317.1 MATE efflux family protein [Mycoplasmopsis columbinasalis]
MQQNKEQKLQKSRDRAEELFAHTPIRKAIWIVAVPSLLITLMIGLYSFVDQVFIQQFVPRTKVVMRPGDGVVASELGELSAYLQGSFYSVENYLDLLQKYNSISGVAQIVQINANSIVSATNAGAQPILIFSNSIVFLVPLGASIYYTKCLSKKMHNAARNMWATMFWVTIALSLVATLLVIVFIVSGIFKLLVGQTKIDQAVALANGFTTFQVEQLQAYYNAAFQLSIDWAKEFTYVYASGTVLQGLVTLLSFFIRAEGFNTYTMGVGIVANLINIALDALFIIVFHLGILGGALATLIGWAFNVFCYVIYIQSKHKKQEMLMSMNQVVRFKFAKELLAPTFLLGLGGFIRSFGVSFSFFVLNILITKPNFADPGHFQFYWAKSTPIITLFLISVFGISDGARSLLQYNYTRRDFKRCKEVYLWTIVVSITYAVLVYLFILGTAGNLWVLALNVTEKMRAATAQFIQIMTLRIVTTSLSVCSLLAFQGTNNIEKSLLAAALENFVSFLIIIPLGFGFAMWAWNSKGDKYLANWILMGTFLLNSLIASTTLLLLSRRYIYKVLPKINDQKLSWSRKIEHKFFESAMLYEAKQGY